jgi:putative ABC transport system permease protein
LLALQQTMIIAVAGLVVGGVLFVIGREAIRWSRPQFLVVATGTGIARAIGAAVLMGAVAALIPARRLARLEPATAYRGG